MNKWSTEEDNILLELISLDTTFAMIAKQIGRSRNSCIGRMHRLGLKLDNGIDKPNK